VTAGIVSAKGRRDIKPGEGAFYSNFIQTDASINPGNSGGPLLNLRGEVVGINTAISRVGQGIGFAIPVNMVKSILPMLRTKGFVERSWMGIAIQALDRNLARSFGLNKAHGALVTSVDPTGPAASAGIKGGDIIIGFDGKRIRSSDELPWAASLAGVGRTVPLMVWREGAKQSMKMTLAPMPHQAIPRDETAAPRVTRVNRHGMDLGFLSGRGVFIEDLEDGSPAKASGLRLGDVIVEFDGEDVKEASALEAALEETKGVIVRLKVQRLGALKYFAFPNP
jgi:serine protease Do